jgi:predicted SAM-dependent methyltransferase
MIQAFMENHMVKLNLGCWDNIIEGWENLDWKKHNDGVVVWEWNKPLPYPDGSAEIVLVQHVMMYCDLNKYVANLKEIARVLADGGVLLLKEDDNRNWQWRKIGTKHKTGKIRSSVNPDQMRVILAEAGLEAVCDDIDSILSRHGSVINRQRKLRKGFCFLFECRKKS